jgi:hypothetical protein
LAVRITPLYKRGEGEIVFVDAGQLHLLPQLFEEPFLLQFVHKRLIEEFFRLAVLEAELCSA